MLNLLGFLIALPFVVLALVVLSILLPFSLLDGGAALFGLVVAGLAIAFVVGVLGLVGTLVAAIVGLVGAVLGGVFGLLLPLVLAIVAIALVGALIPLLLPFALLAGVVWLIARAARRSPPAPPALAHRAA